jgi:hypothetical protein
MSRTAPSIDDLLCEGCGYNLAGLPSGGACPECGRSVRSSVIDNGRRGTPYEIDRKYRTTLIQWIIAPTRSARAISVDPHPSETRYAWVTLMLAACLAWPGVMLHLRFVHTLIAPILPPSYGFAGIIVFAVVLQLIPFLGAFLMSPGVGIRLIAYLTSLEGAYWGYRLPALRVRRVLCYLTSQFVPWSGLASGLIILYMLLRTQGFLPEHPPHWYLYGLCVFVVIASGAIFFSYVLAMGAIRYANQTGTSVET